MSRAARVALIVAVAAAMAVVVVGCGPRAPTDAPAMEGTITTATPNASGNAGSILVEGQASFGDKATFEIQGTTPILVQAKDGILTAGTFADLKTGVSVEVWTDEPVRESYPVQATASMVLVAQ
jgi:hypothetical protein